MTYSNQSKEPLVSGSIHSVEENIHILKQLHLSGMANALNEIGGPLVAGKIETSIIEDKHRFLSGCALAIRELFFNRGGFDTNS